ncbi:uncharacterized protein LOC114328799 [Diabrotica virgifera virgifera]|uniref:Uncharacterized protein LOC114328799 n=1 Tax=Diabrotica virgifera virgifera TaxID=50390 RepID=A0A6P7FFA4_DIAVI|nr:uncharacterized protein LOC114328799 [Diabrotica virgifera virgifera]XP_028133562.1 uncharacterized protein LOC114328799 [Diabrotica virgifera virgifera]
MIRITVILSFAVTVCKAQFFLPPRNEDFDASFQNTFEQWLDIDRNTGIVRYHFVHKDDKPIFSPPTFDYQGYQRFGPISGHASLVVSVTKNWPFPYEFVLDVAKIRPDRIGRISPYDYEILEELKKLRPIIQEAINNPSKNFKPPSTFWKPDQIISPSFAKYLQMKGLLPIETESEEEVDNPWSEPFWNPSEIISPSYGKYLQSKGLQLFNKGPKKDGKNKWSDPFWNPSEIISPSYGKYLQNKGLQLFNKGPKKDGNNKWSTFWNSQETISSSYAHYPQSKSGQSKESSYYANYLQSKNGQSKGSSYYAKQLQSKSDQNKGSSYYANRLHNKSDQRKGFKKSADGA